MVIETQQPAAPTSAPVTATNSDASEAAKPLPLRRACDCCRKRKVRCDGSEPCGPCSKASIRCAYLQPPKKKGPKGLRSARVLHALRRIDDTANGTQTSPLSPQQHGAFGDWGWSSATTSPTTMHYPDQMIPPPNLVYGPPTSVAPDQSYYSQDVPPAMNNQSQQQQLHQQPSYQDPPLQQEPRLQHTHQQYPQRNDPPQTQPISQTSLYGLDTTGTTWDSQVESVSAGSDMPRILSPPHSEPLHQRIPGHHFLPYVQLFFGHMFPIMPVIDRTFYLDAAFYSDSSALSSDMYCFLCALCAATIVQLDTSIPQPPPLHPNKPTDDMFAEECLHERKTYDYIDPTSTLSIMTSFFLFAYYGNHEKHGKAWHYLQESITFSENLDMDNEQSYAKLDPIEAQWRRRLYWLLFITERAYAVQRRKHTRLHASVHLPAVFESEDPQLLNGFVNLANLFSAVDDSFVSAWRGSRRQSLCNEAWLANTQKQLDAAALALDNISETQHLDISITREWLHVLAWQMGVSNGLIWGKGEGGMRLDYPIELARKVVEITSGANALALDSHGIGMEQKLSDIAGCLADVLKCTAGDTSTTFLEGKQYLNILLQTLSSMRGKESRYLKPLMSKMEGLMGYELNNQTLPLPTETFGRIPSIPSDYLTAGPRFSMVESMGMLRTLSMSGNLGMPSLMAIPQQGDWPQRRPSGRVYDEYETKAMGGWLMDGVTQAA